MGSADELTAAVPIIEGKLFFVPLRHPAGLASSALAASAICYSIDSTLLYEPFFGDFGPLSLGKAYRFCQQTSELLQEAERSKRRLYFYCGPQPAARANAAVLIGIYQVIFLNRTADEAYRPLQAFKPYIPFRDASCGVSTFHLTVLDVIKGIQKARDVAFIDWNSGCSTWSLQEYEHYEQVENGDLNWIVPGKLVAFSGPANRGNEIAGYRLHTPEDYWDYWRKRGVTAVVRLNKKAYDRQRFVQGGFRHYDLYFPDGSCPSEAIVLKFLEIAESEPGAVAIHCKAGLGRTGVLICSYIMKHFKFTAEEVIGYIRVCRPGSVIGPQQNFMRDIEARMWHEGDMWRAARGINKAHLALGDLVINGKSAHPSSASDGHQQHTPTSPSAAMNNFGRASPGSPAAYRNNQGLHSAGSMNNMAGSGNGVLMGRSSASSITSAGPASAFMAAAYGAPPGYPGTPTSITHSHSLRDRAAERADSVTSMPSGGLGGGFGAGDLSLTQYKQQAAALTPSSSSGSLGLGSYMNLSVQVPSSASISCSSSLLSPPGSAQSTPTAKTVPAGSNAAARIPARSITPLRYGGSAAANHHGSQSASLGGYLSGVGYAGRMGTAGGHAAAHAVSRSTPSAPLRAPSVDRALDRGTLALRASAPPRDGGTGPPSIVIERNVMSADVSLAGNSRGLTVSTVPRGSNGATQPIPTTPKPAAPGHRPNAGVARTLAPNGQPRKVPLAMLPAYHAGLANTKPGVAGPAGAACALTSSPSSPVSGAGGATTPGNTLELGRLKAQAAQMRYSLYSK